MDSATHRIGALLAPLTNWERTRTDHPRFTLESIRALLTRLGPWAFRPSVRSIQVGGSKGKGTTSAWIAHLAATAGWRCGIYLSPHVSSICERIVLPTGPIGEEPMVHAVETALAVLPGIHPAPSAFEVLTAAAAVAFHQERLDLAVFEVGLGGRLDATTALDVDLSVLTGVELEHTTILGDTIAAIAREKVHVFREGKVGICGCTGTAAQIAADYADRIGCRLRVRGVDFGLEASPRAADGARELRLFDGRGAPQTLRLADAPAFHLPALALAWAAVRELNPDYQIPAGLHAPELPGRFECRTDRDGQLLIFDGAHTEESAGRLAEELAVRWPGRHFAVLFATARGKRWQSVLSRIAPLADQVVVTELADTPSEDAATIVDWLVARGSRARAVPTASEGLASLREHATPRIVTGSFHLVGELRDKVP